MAIGPLIEQGFCVRTKRVYIGVRICAVKVLSDVVSDVLQICFNVRISGIAC